MSSSTSSASRALEFKPLEGLPTGVPSPDLFHLSGAPVRAAVCDARLFKPTRPASGGPTKAPVYGQMDQRLWQLPGAYCLLWDPEPGARRLYVGSSGALFTRLIGHPKTGWTQAILLTGYGIGRGGAEQVESAIAKVLRAARPANLITPEWDAMPSPWGADMPWHLIESLIVLLNRCLDELGLGLQLNPAEARL